MTFLALDSIIRILTRSTHIHTHTAHANTVITPGWEWEESHRLPLCEFLLGLDTCFKLRNKVSILWDLLMYHVLEKAFRSDALTNRTKRFLSHCYSHIIKRLRTKWRQDKDNTCTYCRYNHSEWYCHCAAYLNPWTVADLEGSKSGWWY